MLVSVFLYFVSFILCWIDQINWSSVCAERHKKRKLTEQRNTGIRLLWKLLQLSSCLSLSLSVIVHMCSSARGVVLIPAMTSSSSWSHISTTKCRIPHMFWLLWEFCSAAAVCWSTFCIRGDSRSHVLAVPFFRKTCRHESRDSETKKTFNSTFDLKSNIVYLKIIQSIYL